MPTRLIYLLAALCLFAAPAWAQSAADLHARMVQRLPIIDELKAKEAVGENNRGYLEARGAGSAATSGIVADENRDREAVYAFLARQTGATPDSVGQARARQIAVNSRVGVWIQEVGGAWKKK